MTFTAKTMATPKTDDKTSSGWFNMNWVGLALVLAATGYSMVRVMNVDADLSRPDEIYIRLAHWQLEEGYRDSMAHIIEQYQLAVNGPYADPKYNDPANVPTDLTLKTRFLRDVKYQGPFEFGKPVRIIQMGVTERVYPQWVNTRLISRDAPDLIEIGKGEMAKNEEYLARFFRPVTDETAEPNRFNEGTNLEGVPWRETLIDGNRAAFKQKVQEYLAIPTTMYPTRLYVNMRLLREAKQRLADKGMLPEDWSDLDDPPHTFGQLMLVCVQMGSMERRDDGSYGEVDEDAISRSRIVPIAGSAYGVTGEFLKRYAVAFQAHMGLRFDLGYDGTINGTEGFLAFHRGQVDMHTPEVKRYWECIRELCKQFGKGFFAQDRQNATFNFVQGRAGMICTGSWEASGLIAGGKRNGFEVSIIDFPLPGPGEPFYDDIVGTIYPGMVMRASEAGVAGGGLYGVYKFSKHPDAALDFMKFITAQRWNGEFTTQAELLPITIGADVLPIMEPFMPDPEGVPDQWRWRIEADKWQPVANKMANQQWPYLQGTIQQELYANEYDAKLSAELEKLRSQLSGDALAAAEAELRARIDREVEERAYEIFATGYIAELLDPQTGAPDAMAEQAKQGIQLTRNLEPQLAAYAVQWLMIDRLLDSERESLGDGEDLDRDARREHIEDSAYIKYRKVLLQQMLRHNGAAGIEQYERVYGRRPPTLD